VRGIGKFARGWSRQSPAALALAATASVAFAATGCVSQDKAASSLLDAFGGACQTKGRWTEVALAHNQALVAVLEEIKNTDECKPFIKTFESIRSLSANIQGLLTDPQYSQIRELEESEQNLALALAGETDPDKIAIFKQALAETQVELALAKAKYTTDTESGTKDHFAESTLALAQAVQGTGEQTQGMGSCLQKAPALAIHLATNLAALGGSFLSPIVGAAAAAIGQLINYGVTYAVGAGTEAAIWKLHSAKMPVALSCGYEAMTDLYCKAQDAFTLLAYQGRAGSRRLDHPVWRDVHVLRHALPVMVGWLQQVRNGVPPNDEFEAEKQTRIWRKMQEIPNADRRVTGYLNKQLDLHSKATDDGVQRGIRKETVRNIALGLGSHMTMPGNGGGESGPFSEFEPDPRKYACWLALGYGEHAERCPILPSTPGFGVSPQDLDQFITQHLLTSITMSSLPANWESILAQVTRKVENEFFATITIDVPALLATAFEPKGEAMPPIRAFTKIRDFLRGQLENDDGSNPQLRPLLEETLALVDEGIRVLNEARDPDHAVETITRLYLLFQLKDGTQFIKQRVARIVGFDLERRLESGDLPDDVTEILLALGGDLQERLAASGVENLDQVSLDLSKAITLTQANITVFRKYFRSSTHKSIKRLREAALQAGEPASGGPELRPNGQSLAELCVHTLATGAKWPKGVKWENCENAVLETIYDAPLSTRVGALALELEGQPYRTRFCAFHRFMRQGRLLERQRRRGDDEARARSLLSVDPAAGLAPSHGLYEAFFGPY